MYFASMQSTCFSVKEFLPVLCRKRGEYPCLDCPSDGQSSECGHVFRAEPETFFPKSIQVPASRHLLSLFFSLSLGYFLLRHLVPHPPSYAIVWLLGTASTSLLILHALFIRRLIGLTNISSHCLVIHCIALLLHASSTAAFREPLIHLPLVAACTPRAFHGSLS